MKGSKVMELFEERLALKERRGEQTWVEHAAHITGLTCVFHRYTLTSRKPVYCYQLV